MSTDVMTDVHRLPLPSGHVAIIDVTDRKITEKYRWHALVRPSTTYVLGYLNRPSAGRRLLHRLLMSPPDGLVVDHINGNGLDNRRSNLRLATRAQNNANGRIRSDNASGYRGVSWNAKSRKWQAAIKPVRQRFPIYLGIFDDPWEAAQAWNAAALKEWGDFARLNQRLRTK